MFIWYILFSLVPLPLIPPTTSTQSGSVDKILLQEPHQLRQALLLPFLDDMVIICAYDGEKNRELENE